MMVLIKSLLKIRNQNFIDFIVPVGLMRVCLPLYTLLLQHVKMVLQKTTVLFFIKEHRQLMRFLNF